VFGKRQDPHGAYAAVIPLFIKQLINHEQPIINGDGKHSRDFTYIKNVIQANVLAAVTDNESAVNQVYNVAYGENNNLNQLVAILKENLSKYDIEIKSVQAAYGSERPGDVKHSLASVEKAKKLLAYHPEYSLTSGLEEAIDWYWNNL
jgi:UDP-N-acetylglucosamine 4-epimerase